ncbi:MAG: hypothetical protein LBG97_06455, partial [Coriobacteriales bacterium]|nr:hypothetical protein [Coriobacteriales bacterium]
MSNATIIGLVTGVAVFIVVITAVLVLRWFLRKRKGAEAFRRDFIRASLSSSNNEDKRRLSGETIDRRGFDLRTTQQRGRFYVFGIVIAALFGTLAVKLWSLQILSKDRYLVQANQNMSSSVPLPAARGRLLDRNGVELVGNRPSTIISGQKSLADDRRLVHRLSLVLGV